MSWKHNFKDNQTDHLPHQEVGEGVKEEEMIFKSKICNLLNFHLMYWNTEYKKKIVKNSNLEEKLLKVNCICHICLKCRNKIFFWIEI